MSRRTTRSSPTDAPAVLMLWQLDDRNHRNRIGRLCLSCQQLFGGTYALSVGFREPMRPRIAALASFLPLCVCLLFHGQARKWLVGPSAPKGRAPGILLCSGAPRGRWGPGDGR
jgi:hypothetical protein